MNTSGAKHYEALDCFLLLFCFWRSTCSLVASRMLLAASCTLRVRSMKVRKLGFQNR